MLWVVLLFILLQPSIFSKKKARVNAPDVIMRSIAFAVILYFLKLQGLEGFQSAPVPTTGQIPARFVNFLNSVAQAKGTEGFQNNAGSTGGTGAASSSTPAPVGGVAVTYATCTSDTDCAYSVSIMSLSNNPPQPTQGCAPLNATTTITNTSATTNPDFATGVFLYQSSQTLEMFDKSGNSIPFTAMNIKSTLTDLGLSEAQIKAMNIPAKYDTYAFALGKGIKALVVLAAGNTPTGVNSDALLSVVNKSASTIPTTIKLTPATFFTTPVLIGIGVGVIAILLLSVLANNGSGSSAASS